jgi:hypothetical protein
MLKEWHSFTPEWYLSLEGAVGQTQLYSFTNGVANIHYSTLPTRTYGSIYGTSVNRTLRVIMSLDNLKKKQGLAFAIYSHTPWFIDQAITEAGQFSRTLLEYIQKALNFYYGPFLCALNTLPDPNQPAETGENSLTDGDKLYGDWIDCRFIGDPTYDTTYTELQGVTIAVFGDETTSATQ